MISDAAERKRETLAAIAIFIFLTAVCLALGFRFHIPYGNFQLLAREWLENRLAESIWHLHSQPPLLNLFLGLALKLESLTGLRAESTLFIAHVAVGCAAVFCLARVAFALIANRMLRRLALALILFHPTLYMVMFDYFYTFHEIVLLAVIAWCALRYLNSPSTRSYLVLCFPVVALVYTRALFHPIWAAGLLLLVAWNGARLRERRLQDTPELKIAMLALVVILFWPAKNAALFGVPSYSSWQGCNFSQDLLESDRLSSAPIYKFPGPKHFSSVAVLSERSKAPKAPNYHHYGIIGTCREASRDAREVIARDPAVLLRRAFNNYYWMTRFSARDPYLGGYATAQLAPELARPWLRAYEVIVYQDAREGWQLMHPKARNVENAERTYSGFYFLFPLMMLASLAAIMRSWRRDPIASRLALCLWASVAWVTLMILFVDGAEGNRIRFPVEPYLWLLVFWSGGIFYDFISTPRPNLPERLARGT